MKNLVLAATMLVFATTGQAQADFKLFEFNLGEDGSLRNTILESLDGRTKPTATKDSQVKEVNIDDLANETLIDNLKVR